MKSGPGRRISTEATTSNKQLAFPCQGNASTLEEETVARIGTWGEQDFTDAEKSAFHHPERIFIDHNDVDQSLFDELLEFYNEEQILEFGWAVASYMAFGRLVHTFGLRPS